MITATSLSNDTMTIILDHGTKILSAKSSHPQWNTLLDAYRKKDEMRLTTLLVPKTMIEEYSYGQLIVRNSTILYKNQELHGLDVDRVFGLMRLKVDYTPIIKFLDRKLRNPSKRAINEMYPFLEHKYMPLTPQGTIIAYKGVLNDFYSVNSGTEVLLQGRRNAAGQIFNGVGETIEMDRSSVDDDFNVGCSSGLHAGSLEYATSWAKNHDGIVILIEIDPENVVSIPKDCNFQKMRCCKYKVVGTYNSPLPHTYIENVGTIHPPSVEEIAEKGTENLSPSADVIDPNNSKYSNGYALGRRHGKNHEKRLYRPEDEIKTDLQVSQDFVCGYNMGYIDGRSNNQFSLTK